MRRDDRLVHDFLLLEAFFCVLRIVEVRFDESILEV